MISVYQLFKIVFGVIISAFIIFFLITYAGVYSSIEEEKIQAEILQNFAKVVKDVYFYGNPTDFPDFAMFDFNLVFDLHEPVGIMSDIGKIQTAPLLFSPGDNVFISRAVLDIGWWKFRMAEAMPETWIFFNPIEGEEAIDLTMEIASFMPSTTYHDINITFGFCDGGALIKKFCGASDIACERDAFVHMLSIVGQTLTFSKCSVSPNKMPPNSRLVTISDGCSQNYAIKGICIKPPDPDGIGRAYISGSDKEFLYKDPLDLVALIIGGESKTVFGLAGENLYIYKNNLFAEEVGLAAKIMRKRALLIGPSTDCASLYTTYANALNEISNILLDENYDFTNPTTMRNLVNELKNAKSIHSDLVNEGCEYAG